MTTVHWLNVYYTANGNKKRKVCSDGMLRINSSVDKFDALLYNVDYEQICKTRLPVTTSCGVGDELLMGNFSVTIDSLCDENEKNVCNSKREESNVKSKKLKNVETDEGDCMKSKKFKSFATVKCSLENEETDSKKVKSFARGMNCYPLIPQEMSSPCEKESCIVDPSLVRSMRPHQLDAVQFLLDRLCDAPGNTVDSSSNHDLFLQRYTGAVLADEMGLG